MSDLLKNWLILIDFCSAVKIEKKAGEEVNYMKMKVKELKTILGFVIFVSVNFNC